MPQHGRVVPVRMQRWVNPPEIGILLPNNQRQHRTLHILEDKPSTLHVPSLDPEPFITQHDWVFPVHKDGLFDLSLHPAP